MPTYFQQNDDGEFVEVEVPDPADFRGQIEALTSENKDLKRRWKDAEPIVAQHQASERVTQVNKAFTDAGLSEDAAKAFVISNPSNVPSEEQVKAFAEMFPQFKAAAKEEKPPESQQGNGAKFSFNATVPDGAPQQRSVTYEEYKALRDQDPSIVLERQAGRLLVTD